MSGVFDDLLPENKNNKPESVSPGVFDDLKPEDKGFTGALIDGAKSTGRAISSTYNTYTGDGQAVVDNSKEQELANEDKSQDIKNFQSDFAANTGVGTDDEVGLWGAIKGTGKAIIDNPRGAALSVVEQFPNSVPTLAAGWAGAKGGAMAGGAVGSAFGGVGAGPGALIGGAAGFAGGMFLGNTLTETGHKAQEYAADGEFTPDEQSAAMTEGAKKAGAITAVDALTFGIGGKISSTMRRTAENAVEAATRKTLIDAGVDISDATAVSAARSSQQLAKSVSEAQQNAAKIADSLRKRAAEAGVLLTVETIGEGLGEYLGELAATGQASVSEAVLESFLSLGQSSVQSMFNFAKTREKSLTEQEWIDAANGIAPEGMAQEEMPAADGMWDEPTPEAKIDMGQMQEGGVTPPPVFDQQDMASKMGINPNDGPLSAAAAQSVNSTFNNDGTTQPSINQQLLEQQGVTPPPVLDAGQLEQGLGERPRSTAFDDSQVPDTEINPYFLEREGVTPSPVLNTDQLDSNLAPTQQAAPKQPAQKPAAQRTPEQDAQSIWDSLNAFERNAAAIDVLGMRGVPAKNAATRKWDALGTEQKAKLIGGLAANRGQRWTDPNRSAQGNTGPVLQNRDRTSGKALEQMRDISNKPDYMRLGYSRDFGNGAPVIEEGLELPASQLGKQEQMATSQGRRMPVQYAVIESDQLLPSNQSDGTVNTTYATGEEGKSRAIAGNGRVAGLQAAWRKGNADTYKIDMIEDAGAHGIDGAVIQKMKQPVLVRVMPRSEITQNIGDESNRSGQLDLNKLEQAKTDMRRLNLLDLKYGANGQITPETVMQFIQSMPSNENLMIDGEISSEATDRLETAVFHKAYDNDKLTVMQSQKDDESKSIIAALLQAAPHMIKLENAGIYDIRPLIIEAAMSAINARRRGIRLSEYVKQAEMGISPEAYPIMEMMLNDKGTIRSGKYIGEQFINMVDTAFNEADKPSTDMYGDVPKRTQEQTIKDSLTEVEGYGQLDAAGSAEVVGQQGRPESATQVDEGQPGRSQRPADTRQAESVKQEAEPAQQLEKWRSNYLQAAKAARDLGIDPKQHKKLIDLIAAIDAANNDVDTVQPEQLQPQQQPSPLDLTQQTEESRAAAERAEKVRLEDEKKAQEKQAKTERKTREKAADEQAIESSLDRFELGQSAEQQLSGQEDIFSTENTKAEAGVTTATDSAQVAVTDSQYNPNPSEAQKEAGNYKKAHVKFQGIDITIENPVGSERSGVDPDGNTWSNTIKHDYGYIKRTTGADGDHVDVFIGKDTDSDKVFVIDQPHKNGKFDEHKVMLGFKGQTQAVAAYKGNYQEGWKVGPITEMTVGEFKQWLSNGDTTKPVETVAKPAAEQAKFSRSKSTETNYEARIDELFNGAKRNRKGVKVLDRADILDLLGHGDKPLHLVESAVQKKEDGEVKHKGMTAEQWKKLPDWIEDPVAAFRSATVKDRITLISPELIDGKPVLIVLEPSGEMGGMDVHVAVNAYEKDNPASVPAMKWVKEDKTLLYLNQKESPALAERSGLQLPRDVRQLRGYEHRVQTETDLFKYRSANKTSFSFAGKTARGADLASLDQAQLRIASGDNAETVRQETGWHRGNDGKWRFEISDDQAKLRVSGKTAGEVIDSAALDAITGGRKFPVTSDLIDHAQLFVAYPKLSNIKVERMPEGGTALARLKRRATGFTIQLRDSLPRDKVASAILHELQHGIQVYEGFAVGGSKNMVFSDLDVSGAKAYRALAGEVEARNTQTRHSMTPALRRNIAPELTQDTPRADVIVTFNGQDITSKAMPSNVNNAPITDASLVRAFDVQFPRLTKAVRTMLARGNKGEHGGVVVIDSADPLMIARAFASKTGKPITESVQMFSDAGSINGFYDPKSGLTFLVGPNLNPVTGTAVLLHEMIHGQQRQKIDKAALSMLMNRGKEKNAETRAFLDRVAARMDDAGETANAQEAGAYIVEQAVTEGKSAGYGTADSKFLSWVDQNIGNKVGDFLRSLIGNVRSWALRNGLPIGPVTVDDLVSYAMAGMKQAGRGNVDGGSAGFSRDATASLEGALAKLDALGLKHQISERNDIITVNKIVVPGDKRGEGKGSAAMQVLTDYADATGKHVALTPTADFGGNKARLKEFYQRFGFKENKGKSKIYEVSEGMVRENPNGRILYSKGIIKDRAEGQQQFAQTEKAYGGRAAYDQAKSEGKTKLNYQQWVQVRTPAFIEWFGDWQNGQQTEKQKGSRDPRSNNEPAGRPEQTANAAGTGEAGGRQDHGRGTRIPDILIEQSTGEPKVFYHGTRDSFEAFDLDHPNRKDAGWLGRGAYAASDARMANTYAKLKNGDGSPNVMPLFIRSTGNVYQVDPLEKQKLSQAGQDNIDAVTRRMMDNGFDGAYVEHSGSVEIATFSPNNVKSASGNNGEFDSNNPSIRFSKSQVKKAAFKKAFGKSKVVDSKGEPLLVYHGSGAKFATFDKNKRGATTRAKSAEEGFFFTSSKSLAYDFKKQAEGAVADLDAIRGAVEGLSDSQLESLASDIGRIASEDLDLEGRDFFIDSLMDMYEYDTDINTWPEESNGTPKAFKKYIPKDILEPGAIHDVYLRIENPHEHTFSEDDDSHDEGAITKAIIAAQKNGNDGVILRNMVDVARADEKGNNAIRSDVYIAFEPDQIIQSEDSAGIRFSRSANPASVNAEPSGMAAWESPSASKFDSFVYKIQDKHVDTKRVIEAILDTGKTINDDLDVYLQETLFHGRAAKRTQDFLNKEVNPLVEYMQSAKVEMSDLEEFLHARHAQEANALIAKRDPNMPDGGSGMTNAEAAKYLNSLNGVRRKQFENAAKMVDKIIGGTRATIVGYGLESQETVDDWAAGFKHYIPLQREDKDGQMGIGQGFSVKGKETKGRTGSTRKVVDILANVMMQRERIIVRGEKNRVAAALLGLAKDNPLPEFWKVDVLPTSRVIDKATGMVRNQVDPAYKSRDNAVVAKVNGKEHAVLMNEDDPRAMRMAEALKNLDAAQLEGLLGATATATRYFAAVNTQYNPIFGVTNFVRDIQEAMLHLQSTPLTGKQARLFKNTFTAVGAVMKAERDNRKGNNATGKWGMLWEDFQNTGGQTGFRDQFSNSADRGKKIQKALTPDGWADTGLGKLFTAGGVLKAPLEVVRKKASWMFDLLSDYNTAMENGVRLSAYETGINAGMSKEQAAALAKGLTVNFNRKGQVTQQVGALYAFFNASVQGSARLGQSLFDMAPGKPKTMRLSKLGKRIVSGGVLLGASQTVLLAMMGFDDDEPPEFIRERNIIIPTGGKTYISIPMPLGYHVIANLGRIPTEFALGGGEDAAKHLISLLDVMSDVYNPLGSSGLSMQTIAPTVLDPLAALAENKDFSGRAIAKESFNRQTPGHTLARDTASLPATWLSELVNYATGGTEFTKGELSPTPDQIDYLVGQLTGGVGRETTKFMKSIQATATGDDLLWHNIPLAGRFFGDADSDGAKQSAFYNNMDKVRKHAEEVKGLRASGRSGEAVEYANKHPHAKLHLAARAAEKQVKGMRDRKRELEQAGAPREEIRALEKRMIQRMEQFVELSAVRK
ncbi:MAG: LPD38 domain-containing protein [Desulfuromonas sp.]|nr:LPD38 domain-containing protein [Desulfuromonas sp.]